MTDNSPSTKDEFFRQLGAMYEFSADEVVNRYWADRTSINTHGFVPFQFDGEIAWEPEGETASCDRIELQTGFWEMEGRVIGENPVLFHRQFKEGRFLINGKFRSGPLSDSPQVAKNQILKAVDEISLLAGLCSWCFLVRVDWFPARYLKVRHIRSAKLDASSPDEFDSFEYITMSKYGSGVSSLHLNSASMTEVLQQHTRIATECPAETRHVLHRSLTWLRLGLLQDSRVNRFLNCFQAVESLVNGICPKETRKRDEKKDEILQLLGRVDRSNVLEVVGDASRIVHQSTRDKFGSFLKWLYPDSAEADHQRDEKTFKGFFDVRNKIAHGLIHETEFHADTRVDRAGSFGPKNLRDLLCFARRLIGDVMDKGDGIPAP